MCCAVEIERLLPSRGSRAPDARPLIVCAYLVQSNSLLDLMWLPIGGEFQRELGFGTWPQLSFALFSSIIADNTTAMESSDLYTYHKLEELLMEQM